MKKPTRNRLFVSFCALVFIFAIFWYLPPVVGNCDGYWVGPFCTSDIDTYCKYGHFLETGDRCSCEAISGLERTNEGVTYKRFCRNDGSCYNSPWEYEYGCDLGITDLDPLREEYNSDKTVSTLVGSCIGSGCFYTPYGKPGFVECRGYKWEMFCFSSAQRYCKYAHPSESLEKCVCESRIETELYSSDFRKFCEKDGVCYTNNWEYEFGCANEKDVGGVCNKVKEELLQRERKYVASDDSQRVEIFNEWNLWRGVDGSSIEGESILIKDICPIFCKNCDDELCKSNHLCELAVVNSS